MFQFTTNMTALDIILLILIGVIAIFIAGWIGKLRGRHQTEQQYASEYEDAISQFAKRLSTAILGAHELKEDQRVRERAKAIVSIRNEMRETLTNLASLLNSEIDHLQKLVEDPNVKIEFIRETLAVLNETWSTGKSEIIEIGFRKLLAELGLERNTRSERKPRFRRKR